MGSSFAILHHFLGSFQSDLLILNNFLGSFLQKDIGGYPRAPQHIRFYAILYDNTTPGSYTIRT